MKKLMNILIVFIAINLLLLSIVGLCYNSPVAKGAYALFSAIALIYLVCLLYGLIEDYIISVKARISKKKKQDRGTEGRNLTIKAQMIDIDGTYEVLFYGKSLDHCVSQANAWADKYNCVLKAMSISQR